MPTQGERFQLGSRTSLNGMNLSKMHRRFGPKHERNIDSPSCLKPPFCLSSLLFSIHIRSIISMQSILPLLAWWTVSVYRLLLICAHYTLILPVRGAFWMQKKSPEPNKLGMHPKFLNFLKKWNFWLAEGGLVLLLTDVTSFYSWILNHLQLIKVERPRCSQTLWETHTDL